MKPLIFCCAFLALPIQAKTSIEQAYEAGVLDLETALLYQIQAIHNPDILPVEYREPRPQATCGTPVIIRAHQAREQLGAAYGARLGKILSRPLMEKSYVTPAGRFRVHYDLSGHHAVDSTDADGNGLSDYVDVTAAVLDSVWELEIGLLGYHPPPIDRRLGGGSEYDVYIVELGGGGGNRYYGLTYPDQVGPTSSSYIEIDNNFIDPGYAVTRGLGALRVTIAHEFFHAVQFGYYQGSDSSWWQEATSTWMEEVAYPEIDDYLQYLSDFMSRPERALNSANAISSDNHGYGAALFAHFLDQRYERSLIRATWEEMGRRGSGGVEPFDHVIRQVIRNGLAGAMSEFAIWNYFTGTRHRRGFYREGDKYPAVRLRDIQAVAKRSVERSDVVDHMASTYIHLEPRLRSGGLVLDFEFERGRWNRQLILVSRDSLEIRSIDASPVQISGWDRYEDIVLVLTVSTTSGSAFGYSLSAEYDPDFVDTALPLALFLRQNAPNPFRPGVHRQTEFVYDLAEPSSVTRLSIFSADGRLVRRFDLGARSSRTHVQSWDGNNEDGKWVGSGIYYCVLEADGTRIAKTLAVLRE